MRGGFHFALGIKFVGEFLPRTPPPQHTHTHPNITTAAPQVDEAWVHWRRRASRAQASNDTQPLT